MVDLFNNIDVKLGEAACSAIPLSLILSPSATSSNKKCSTSANAVIKNSLSTPVGTTNNKSSKRRPRESARDCENERKRLRRELDKALKVHRKASKALDDFQGRVKDRYVGGRNQSFAFTTNLVTYVIDYE